MTRHLHLALALQAGGWHPTAQHDADPSHHTADHWGELARQAERGLLDFITIEDTLVPGGPPDGRLDAPLLATIAATRTSHLGLVPSITLNLTQPFHTATTIASLDHLSGGRAGLRHRVTGRTTDMLLLGKDTHGTFDHPDLNDPAFHHWMTRRFDEAADHLQAVRRLWTHRPVTHEGPWYRTQGRLNTPPTPQTCPPLTSLAHLTVPYRLAAKASDVVYTTPHDRTHIPPTLEEIRALQAEAGRADQTLHVFADLIVLLDTTPAAAAARKDRLDTLAGAPLTSDAKIFTGTPAELADLLLDWHSAGVTGFRLRPAALPHDLLAVTCELVPLLQKAGRFRERYETTTLRGHLGLTDPA